MKTGSEYVYDLISSPMGKVGIVRRTKGARPVRMIFLPHKGASTRERIREAFPGVVLSPGKRDNTGKQIDAYLMGNAVDFSIAELDFEGCGEFERRVLLAVHQIPRGRVMTYGGVAAIVGVAGGARAVGNVMAGNFFPLIIPCHRVIRSDGSLGGFGGGLALKRALLEREGVAFDRRERVLPEHILPGPAPRNKR
ncbi:MAG: methylated-DNA--[protein]-cysteine S-methyltransferase [Deltaproteobacteria bacterium]|nr:methylated-DNA--[protein]-cysteine S-methyltransferase [Deltaproteobacteria bacterium]